MFSWLKKSSDFDEKQVEILNEIGSLIFQQTINNCDSLLKLMLELIEDQHPKFNDIEWDAAYTYSFCFQLYKFQLCLKRFVTNSNIKKKDDFTKKILDITYLESKKLLMEKFIQLETGPSSEQLDDFIDLLLGMLYGLELCPVKDSTFRKEGDSVVNYIYSKIFSAYGYDCKIINILVAAHLKLFILKQLDNESETLFIPALKKL